MPRAGFRPTFKYTTPSLHAFFVWCVWIPDKVPQPKHVRLGHFVLASRMVLVTGASYWLETIRMSWFSQLSVELLTFPYVCALHFWLLILYNSVDGSLFSVNCFKQKTCETPLMWICPMTHLILCHPSVLAEWWVGVFFARFTSRVVCSYIYMYSQAVFKCNLIN